MLIFSISRMLIMHVENCKQCKLHNSHLHEDVPFREIALHFLSTINNHTNTNARHSQGSTGWVRRVNRKVMQIISCALFPKKHNTDKVNAKEARANVVVKLNYLCCKAYFLFA